MLFLLLFIQPQLPAEKPPSDMLARKTTWEEWKIYKPTGLSQRIVRYVNTGPDIRFFHLDQDDGGAVNVNRVFPWLVPGGLHGLTEWRSELRFDLPDGKIKVWTEEGDIIGAGRLPRKRWTFPVGTRLADVLRNTAGEPFEVRVREKTSETVWKSDVVMRDEDKAPKGYKGPGKACVECHSKAGQSIADGPLLRGDDQTFSAPIPEILAGAMKDDAWPLEIAK